MLVNFILNTIDTFIVVYLWTRLIKENDNILKLMFTILSISILITLTEQLELNFIFIYLIDILIMKLIYRKGFKEIIFGLSLIVVIDIIAQLVLSLIVDKFVYSYTIKGFIIELIILIGIIIFSKVHFLNKSFTYEKLNSNILCYFIPTCGIYIFVFKFVWSYDNSVISDNMYFTAAIFCILITSQVLTYLYTSKVVKEKETLKVSNEYNSVISEIVEEIKQRQHDFVNYKNTIRGIVEVVDYKDVKAAIAYYMKDEDIRETKVNELIYIDNIVIRSIIYRSICKAQKYNIKFQYKIENNVLDNILSYHEISNVLNNLINNAFDEVIKEKCNNKNIEIKIYKENKTSHLTIKNQVASFIDINISEMFTRGYSTKNASTRGYGLYNVQQIINLHKGHIKINIECEEIILDIYFNNSSG